MKRRTHLELSDEDADSTGRQASQAGGRGGSAAGLVVDQGAGNSQRRPIPPPPPTLASSLTATNDRRGPLGATASGQR